MRIVNLICPSCSANLENVKLEDGVNTCFCTYCGAHLAIQDENQFTYRKVDAARIKEAEVAQVVRLKELEMEERRREDEKKTNISKTKLGLILAAIGIVMQIVGYFGGAATGDSNSPFYMVTLAGFVPLIAAAYIGISFTRKSNRGK